MGRWFVGAAVAGLLCVAAAPAAPKKAPAAKVKPLTVAELKAQVFDATTGKLVGVKEIPANGGEDLLVVVKVTGGEPWSVSDAPLKLELTGGEGAKPMVLERPVGQVNDKSVGYVLFHFPKGVDCGSYQLTATLGGAAPSTKKLAIEPACGD